MTPSLTALAWMLAFASALGLFVAWSVWKMDRELRDHHGDASKPYEGDDL